MDDNESEKELIDSVKRHGAAKGVNIMSVYIIYNKFCDNIVGCKLSIPEFQQDQVYREGF
jgi:hypothetical protein